MTRLNSQSRKQPTCPEQLEKIVSILFPKQEPFAYQMEQQDEDIAPVSREELLLANNRVGNNKAPGMDNILNVAMETVIKAAPDMFLDIYNTYLVEGTFPERWKRQKLVFLSKNNKPPDDPSSHRPLLHAGSRHLDAPRSLGAGEGQRERYGRGDLDTLAEHAERGVRIVDIHKIVDKN